MLLYELLDRQLDRYIPLLDQFEDRVEELGDIIFTADETGKRRLDERAVLNDILTAKSSALRLRRILLPQREVLARLARDHYDAIPGDARLYFHDLYDHISRLADLAESMRDLVNGTMTTHLTLASNRLNEIMKVLTIISTIFMPLGFIAAVYGMNFHFMPELNWAWSYPVVWLIFITLVVLMLRVFRQRHWISDRGCFENETFPDGKFRSQTEQNMKAGRAPPSCLCLSHSIDDYRGTKTCITAGDLGGNQRNLAAHPARLFRRGRGLSPL